MCGIGGIIVHGDGTTVQASELQAIGDAQRHRGPDDAGSWLSRDAHIGFVHRRLSIIDLSPGGHQPMTSADGRFWIVFNGEIYNYLQLRDELRAKGRTFSSSSDTEVLIEGYREWGLGLLDRLRGMFAFALHDTASGETLLARDPLGIKPLYYADDGRRLAFASEVQALRTVVSDHAIDPFGLSCFLLWGSIGPERSLHRAIRALPPGAWLRVSSGRVEGPTAYYRLEDELRGSEEMDATEAASVAREALLDSVRHHLVADVPVGSFLSGGVDSSALVGLMSEVHDGAISTVTLSMDAADLDEAALAREASLLYETDHHEIPTGIDDVRERLPAAIASLDQPSIDGINTYFVSEATARTGLKVAISGVGGDELFGGYGTFQTIPDIQRAHRRMGRIPGGSLAIRGASAIAAALPRSRNQGRAARALRFGGTPSGAYFATRALFDPDEVRALLSREAADEVGAIDPRRDLDARVRPDELAEDERVSALEFRQYLQCQLLRDTDATAMRHSLEVRTPLVDRDLLRAVARIPALLRRAGPAKKQLRNAPRPPVPDALWSRKKQGFTMPFDAWLRSGRLDTRLPDHPLLSPAAVRAVADDFTRGRVHWSRLWALIVLREYLER